VLLTVFLAHASADAPFAQDLQGFLETGCDDLSFTPDSAIRPGHDLISTVETGHAADVVVMLLSPASNPPRWPREKWEPTLFANAVETNTRIAVFLIEECTFPGLLRRGSNFFNATTSDATTARLTAFRQLKRWLWGVQSGTSPAMTYSPDLETLYRDLTDRPGTLTSSGDTARRFAHQAARDFAAVVWVPAHGRNLTQLAGDVGFQLGLTLDGQLEENCHCIREELSRRRYLVVLDAPQVPVESLAASDRSSILYTDEPVYIAHDERSLAAARSLVEARRFAEAYELLRELLNAGIEPESCARELVWICDHWDRVDEANSLRFLCPPEPSEQLRLF